MVKAHWTSWAKKLSQLAPLCLLSHSGWFEIEVPSLQVSSHQVVLGVSTGFLVSSGAKTMAAFTKMFGTFSTTPKRRAAPEQIR